MKYSLYTDYSNDGRFKITNIKFENNKQIEKFLRYYTTKIFNEKVINIRFNNRLNIITVNSLNKDNQEVSSTYFYDLIEYHTRYFSFIDSTTTVIIKQSLNVLFKVNYDLLIYDKGVFKTYNNIDWTKLNSKISYLSLEFKTDIYGNYYTWVELKKLEYKFLIDNLFKYNPKSTVYYYKHNNNHYVTTYFKSFKDFPELMPIANIENKQYTIVYYRGNLYYVLLKQLNKSKDYRLYDIKDFIYYKTIHRKNILYFIPL